MRRNVEIKARVDDLAVLVERAQKLAGRPPEETLQHDTFFDCATGRLKLRRLSAAQGELIFYRRADEAGPKASSYLVWPTDDPLGLCALLTVALGATGHVVKHRRVFPVGRTRIHVDRVEDLGDFVELEVVLAEGEAVASGMEEARRLMAALGVEPSRLVEGAYVDLPRGGTGPAPAGRPGS